jgi:Nucleotidyltransferase domain
MEAALNALVQALQRYQPQRIILFGSAARGEADADSDLRAIMPSYATPLALLTAYMLEALAWPALPQASTSTGQSPWRTPFPPGNGSRARSRSLPCLSVAPLPRW